MSLHVGNIPPHIRPETLEQVFRRFGRCMLQMKDGYGFAVYEVTADAEIALRELRGKKICGEPLSLNWSNRQPRPFPRSARPPKNFEPYRRRNLREGDNGVGRGSCDPRNLLAGYSRFPSYNRVRHRQDAADRGQEYVREDYDDIGEERGTTLKDGVTGVGNSSEPNPVNIERWGVNDGNAGTEMRDDSEFDRYEPPRGYDRDDEKEHNHMTSSYGSPYRGSPQGKGHREHLTDEPDKDIDDSKPQPTCYNCGVVGHIKRYCPKGDAKREKFGKFIRRRDEINLRGRNDGNLRIPENSSWGRSEDRREPPRRTRKETCFGKSKRSLPGEDFPERREKKRPKLREQSPRKKRYQLAPEKERRLPKERRPRKHDSSSSASGSSSSSSSSSKSKSRSSSRSTSRSISSKSRSGSSSSRSASTSCRHKSESPRSRSRLRSRSSSERLPSLSVSLEKISPFSPKFVNLDVSDDRASPKGNSENQLSPNSGNQLHGYVGSSEVKDGNGPVSQRIHREVDGGYSGDKVDEANNSVFTSAYKEINSGLNLPKDNSAFLDTSRALGCLDGTPMKPNKQVTGDADGRKSTRITTQEMIHALRQYGLPTPEEGKPDMTVEGYFGAARLWPWEMIYYRRLKKGPISTENYARRLEQNQEFGIVDRYVRSSSGWGEHEQTDRI